MRESRTVEFKETVSQTFLKTVSAFANYGTGCIYFGIHDSGKEIGVADPIKVCLNIENSINESLNPVPNYTLEIIEKSSVIKLTVYEGLHKPYFYKNKAYRRNDSATIEVDRLELTRLILEGQNLSFESLVSQNQDLHFEYLSEQLRQRLTISNLTTDILKTLELYSDNKGYNNAAELLADTNHFCGIDMVRFGDSINILLDRMTFEHLSILKQYELAIQNYRKYYQYEVIDGSVRKQVEMIPESAFREAIANALVHRTWDIQSHIQVSMHADKIEIVSPGGLTSGLSQEDYQRGGISILRNPILGNVFYRLHLIEKFGTGIRRINDIYRSSLVKPQYEVTERTIRIVLPVIQSAPLLSEDEEKLVKVIKSRKMSSSMIAAHIGFGKSKTLSILKKLVQSGVVKTEGIGRGTVYFA